VLLEREGSHNFKDPSEARIRLELKRLYGYGKSSIAYLSAEDGSYVQVAGGNIACVLEWRRPDGRHFRASQPDAKHPFPDGTPLQYSGGRIPLLRHEWFFIEQVADAFVAFRFGRPFPEYISWRDVTEEVKAHIVPA
jgi:hypothetical protein